VGGEIRGKTERQKKTEFGKRGEKKRKRKGERWGGVSEEGKGEKERTKRGKEANKERKNGWKGKEGGGKRLGGGE